MAKLARMGGANTNPDAGFFEGAEKLFECWFDSSTEGFTSLRTLKRADIDHLLTFAKCTVVSEIHEANLSAYLLSESSLFVYDEMIVLKTCGTTTLLHVVPAFLKMAKEKCNATELAGLWYSRKNLSKPELQLGVHQNFMDEVTFLDAEMAQRDLTGGAYMLGRWNGDHWYLYALDNPGDETGEVEATFEILMSDLNQDRMREFFYCDSEDKAAQRRLGKVCTEKSGIGELLKGVVVDETMFYPYGYSMNGIRDRTYYTIHVTPQPDCSYASFETNQRFTNYEEVVRKLVAIFQPSRFIVNLCSEVDPKPNVDADLAGFTRRDLVNYNFGRYTMQMGHWIKVQKYQRTASTVNLLEIIAERDSSPNLGHHQDE